jgi:hypothetical protein
MLKAENLNEASYWILSGPHDAAEVILKRVASELQLNNVGFSLSNVTFSDGRPGLTLHSQPSGRPLGMLVIEQLPNGRGQLRIPPLQVNPSLREQGSASLFVPFMNAALIELTRLGFVVSDGEPYTVPIAAADEHSPFTPEEQAEIVARLTSLETFLLTQFELSRDQVIVVEEEMKNLRNEVSKLSRITWRHLARSALGGIASMLAGQAGRIFLEQALDALRPFYGRLLGLTGE